MEGFRRSDHAMVLSCLTDDVEWLIPGMFDIRGKEAFDKEIENEAFTGHPAIVVTRVTEEADVVIAEGSVRAQKKRWRSLKRGVLRRFRDGGRNKIEKLISFYSDGSQRTTIGDHAVQSSQCGHESNDMKHTSLHSTMKGLGIGRRES